MAQSNLDACEVPQPLAPMPWEKGPEAARPRSDAGGSGFGSHGSGSQSTGASGQGQDCTGESWEEASSGRGSGSGRLSGTGRLSSRLSGGCGAASEGKAKQMEDFLSREGGGGTGAEDALTQGGLPDSSSRDGASRDGSAAADPSDDLRGQLPSLQKDGASANVGSAGHPDECKPCAFYCYSLRGCRNGEACMYCHLFHESRLRQRREEWKRTQREKRRRQREKRDLGNGDGQAEESTRPSTAGVLPVGAVSATSAPTPARKPAQALPAQAGAAALSSAALPGAQATVAASSSAAQPAAQAPRPPPAAGPHASQPSPSLGLLAQAAASMGGGAPLAAGLVTAAGGAEFFAYTPNSAVIHVGEPLELWPPVPLAMSGPIFAVSPELPVGLRIDERMGVIYGKPLVGMSDSTTYFVAACKPGDLSFNVKISMVNLKVLGPAPLEQGF